MWGDTGDGSRRPGPEAPTRRGYEHHRHRCHHRPRHGVTATTSPASYAIEQRAYAYSNIRSGLLPARLQAVENPDVLARCFRMPTRATVHLLWLNLVSDGAPALALGMEKGDQNIMQQPPRPPREPVINRNMAVGISVIAVVDAVAILSVFFLALERYPGHLEAAQTIAFVTLCCSELIRAYTHVPRFEHLCHRCSPQCMNRACWPVVCDAVSMCLPATLIDTVPSASTTALMLPSSSRHRSRWNRELTSGEFPLVPAVA